MAYLTLRNINKIYPNGFHAVHDFNLEAERGEFIVFVGPSGCGKSTTLRMIAGLEDISKGEFLIEGKLANQLSPREREVAMVFQSYALYPHMTVYDNLAFGLSLQGVDEDIIDKRVQKTAKILGLTEYLDRMPRALSGGQRQRVAVGRSIIRKVGIFLMDEPLSNLDAKQRVTMRSEITQIHQETGATTIYVTHDQTEAMTMADRIVVMKDGYVQQIGTPRDVYFHPVNMFVAGFIGEPPMNFIRCAVKDGCMSLGDHTLDLSGKLGDQLNEYEGKEIIFGFRPEAVVLGENSAKYALSGTVELTEMLGDNANVYLDISGDKVIVKVSPHEIPPLESELVFSIPEESIYLFDTKTEMVI
ncbi:MAG: sn-glycerol-3-phosphate ABC transporter ATP-binding protein UgpC [Clostridia bacterium]|nr:sn-glycerol-3-phosphate ABC transporter ATP-binding protein UgpC [Clostridia bacterium]